jgi:excisionase family DNA binding protein
MNETADSEALTLTIPQAAKLLQISPLRAYALAKQGKIPCIHLGRSVRVVRASLVQLLADAAAGREGGIR